MDLGKSLGKPRGLGSLPRHLATTQSPEIGVQEIAVTGESAGFQDSDCFNLVIAPLAEWGKGATDGRLLREGGKAAYGLTPGSRSNP